MQRSNQDAYYDSLCGLLMGVTVGFIILPFVTGAVHGYLARRAARTIDAEWEAANR